MAVPRSTPAYEQGPSRTISRVGMPRLARTKTRQTLHLSSPGCAPSPAHAIQAVTCPGIAPAHSISCGRSGVSRSRADRPAFFSRKLLDRFMNAPRRDRCWLSRAYANSSSGSRSALRMTLRDNRSSRVDPPDRPLVDQTLSADPSFKVCGI